MQFKKINNTISLAGQLTAGDFASAFENGFKTVINARPDAEQVSAINSAEAQIEARANGLAYHYLPVTPANITNEDVASFKTLLAEAEGPVLAHCGTGMRAAVLWALANAGTLATDEILNLAANAGYDLSKVAPRIEQQAG